MKTFKEDYFLGRKLVDLTGQKFGRLTVVERIENRGHYVWWKCLCDCGNFKDVSSGNLRNGTTKSCGCLKEEGNNLKHGKCYDRIYGIYKAMIARCEKEYSSIYQYYGERGISVCQEWKNSFQAFYEWSINNGYKENLTIDRIETNGNYCPENCRWITMKEQNYNRRNSHKFEIDGVVYGMRELSSKIGISEQLIQSRLDHGWTLDEIINTPKGHRRKK